MTRSQLAAQTIRLGWSLVPNFRLCISISTAGTQASSTPSLSSSPLFSDGVVAILMTTHDLKKSLLELTKMYNRAFRTPVGQHPVSCEEMGEALKKLAIFKVSVFL